jgi:hypothetical protein
MMTLDGWLPAMHDHKETTWVHEPQPGGLGTAELYTTDRRLWLRAIARNPNYLQAHQLDHGYTLLYPATEIHLPEMLLRPRPGGAQALQAHLNDAEKLNRQLASERLSKLNQKLHGGG